MGLARKTSVSAKVFAQLKIAPLVSDPIVVVTLESGSAITITMLSMLCLFVMEGRPSELSSASNFLANLKVKNGRFHHFLLSNWMVIVAFLESPWNSVLFIGIVYLEEYFRMNFYENDPSTFFQAEISFFGDSVSDGIIALGAVVGLAVTLSNILNSLQKTESITTNNGL